MVGWGLSRTPPLRRDEPSLYLWKRGDSDRSELSECSPGLAASSGIAVLSPALFTLVAAQHLEPDTRYVSPAVR